MMDELTPEQRENVAVNEAICWDDRKALASIFQDHVRIDGLTDELYAGLIAVAQFGARRLWQNECADR
jgi:hypothetical protein